VVRFQAGKQIRHGRRAAFDRIHVEVADKRVVAHHFAVNILSDDFLGQTQHAVRHGIVTSQNRFAHLVEKVAGAQAQLVAHIRHGRLDEMHARIAFMLAHENFKARLDALARGKTAHVVHVHIGTLRFRHGELAELEETVAWRGGQEIRIAAPRIEHQAVALLGRLDQRVL
jgi:hypothetical protein